LILAVDGVDCSVDILQPKERVFHTPTREELERDKKYSWPPPADRLSIALDTNSRFLVEDHMAGVEDAAAGITAF
jgi:hypothetical protein